MGDAMQSNTYAPGAILAKECGSRAGGLVRAQILPPWYCVHVHHRQEELAMKHLAYQRMRAYFPQISRPPSRPGRPERVLPLFPGYIFVSFDVDRDRWHSIFSTHGVKQLFMDGSHRPRPVPQEALRIMRAIADKPPEYAALPAPAQLTPGQQVRVTAGAFTDFLAIVDWADDKRVGLLLEIFGRSTKSVLAQEHVIPV